MGRPCKVNNNCITDCDMKFVYVRRNRLDPKQDPTSGAYLPAITACQARMCVGKIINTQIADDIGAFSDGAIQDFDNVSC